MAVDCMSRLVVVSVDKSFADTKVLDNITFETGVGEFVVVLGPSGCGKSTLLRLIAGLEQPDRGEIWIGSRRIDKLPPQKRNTALVFQNYALYPHMTVAQNLAFPLKIAGLSRREIHNKIISTASLLGLENRLEARPAELSGGQRQRVALGRAIIRTPDIFLLDEPLSNLDADLRTKMRRELVALQKHLGITTIYVTHDQTEALTMAGRLIVIDEGRIRQIGTVDEIYNRPADIFVASFVGVPKMNLIEGWVSNEIIKPFNISNVIVPSEYRSSEIIMGIRPEDIAVRENGAHAATVKNVEYLGDRAIVTAQLLAEDISIVAVPNRHLPGETLRFSINTDKVHLFDKKTGRCLTSGQ
jgi:multiple sugar transport system ATP-binding protein